MALVTTGSANGTGQAVIKTGIPKDAKGFKLVSQWLAWQTTKTNTRGGVLSNARLTAVQ